MKTVPHHDLIILANECSAFVEHPRLLAPLDMHRPVDYITRVKVRHRAQKPNELITCVGTPNDPYLLIPNHGKVVLIEDDVIQYKTPYFYLIHPHVISHEQLIERLQHILKQHHDHTNF